MEESPPCILKCELNRGDREGAREKEMESGCLKKYHKKKDPGQSSDGLAALGHDLVPPIGGRGVRFNLRSATLSGVPLNQQITKRGGWDWVGKNSCVIREQQQRSITLNLEKEKFPGQTEQHRLGAGKTARGGWEDQGRTTK